jgi:hypothetical protein
MVSPQARKGLWVGRVGTSQEFMTVGFPLGIPAVMSQRRRLTR